MAPARGRARIGVTGPRRGDHGPRLATHLALWLAGARPVDVRPGRAVDPTALDGLVLSGGHDVGAERYGALPELHGDYDPERDELEARVLATTLARRRPVLAICRGAQLLDVCLGGSLIQDLTHHRRLTSNRSTLLPRKAVDVRPGSRLARVLERTRVRVNSLHRQAVERLGEGLRVSARDADGIVQAIELDGHELVLGVQWHPELQLWSRPQRRLFRALVEAAERPGAEA